MTLAPKRGKPPYFNSVSVAVTTNGAHGQNMLTKKWTGTSIYLLTQEEQNHHIPPTVDTKQSMRAV